MLWSYFIHHRELLADLGRLAYETIQEMMAEAVGDPRARPGVVAVPHLIRRVYLTDPLICPDYGGELRVIAFVTEPKVEIVV